MNDKQMTTIRTRYYKHFPALRDAYVVTSRTLAPEQWVVYVWRDAYRTWRVQARLRWHTRGPARCAGPAGVVVPAAEPAAYTTLAAARKRARELCLILGHTMGAEYRRPDGSTGLVGYR